MSRIPWRALALGLAALLGGCLLDIADYSARACDLPGHPCPEGRVCAGGRCVAAEADGGVRWQQWVHGFTALERCDGCAVEVDTGNRNRVIATIPSAVDGADRAVGVASQSPVRAVGPRGRLRGKLLLPSGFNPAADVSVLQLRNRNAGTLIELAITAQGALSCFTSANNLQAAPVASPPAAPLSLEEVHTIEVAWLKGQHRTVWVDGAPYLQQALTDNLNPDVAVKALEVGINRYDGTADKGLRVWLWDWQLSDDPELPLTD